MSRLSTAQTRKVLALNKPFGLTKRHMVVAEVGPGPLSQNAPYLRMPRAEIRLVQKSGLSGRMAQPNGDRARRYAKSA